MLKHLSFNICHSHKTSAAAAADIAVTTTTIVIAVVNLVVVDFADYV